MATKQYQSIVPYFAILWALWNFPTLPPGLSSFKYPSIDILLSLSSNVGLPTRTKLIFFLLVSLSESPLFFPFVFAVPREYIFLESLLPDPVG